MPVSTIQASFAGGEVAPEFQRRVDLQRYASGLKTLRNMIVRPGGGVSNRPGLEYIDTTKDSTKLAVLLPFRYSTVQSYVLEFGELYIRFYKNGAQILSGGAAVETVTAYIELQLADLKYTQSADTLYLVHPDVAPQTLVRVSETSWTLAAFPFKNGPYMLTNTGATTITPSGTALGASITLTASAALFDAGHVGAWWRISSGSVQITAVTNATTATATVKSVLPGTSAYGDWAEGSWSTYRGFPSSVVFYQDRIIFAGTYAEPQTAWSSKLGDYVNFGRSSPLVDSDAITNQLPSREVNKVQNLISMGDILALTSASEWIVGPNSSNAAFTYATAKATCQGYRGSSKAIPAVIGNRIIYVQALGSVLRDIGYSLDQDSYVGDDLSIIANHLLNGYSIIGMVYQQEPDSIIWMVRSDGKLLGCTYNREQQVLAWHHHDTDGEFESICTIPGDTYNEVWFVIKRGTSRFIERLSMRTISEDPADQFFVDCGLSYDVPVTITGATVADPVEITAIAHGFTNGDLIDISDIVWTPDVDNLGNSTQPDQLNEYRYIVAGATTNTFTLTDEDGVTIDGTEFNAYVSGGKARKAVSTVSGLSHLEGKTVAILANGDVLPQQTVTSGAITLDTPASRVHVGLPYISDFETLNVELSTAKGTIQGKLVTIPKVTIMFYNSRGGWIGPDNENMVEIIQRGVEPLGTPIHLFTGDYPENIPTDYRVGGRIFYRQQDPLPVTILGVIPEVVVG